MTPDAECPRWCTSDHDGDTGQRHRSTSRVVPVVEPMNLSDGAAQVGTEATGAEFVVEASRAPQTSEVWVYVGDGFEQSLEVTLESARRLRDALDELLAEVASA